MKNNSDDTLAVLTQCRNVWDRQTDGRTNKSRSAQPRLRTRDKS